jgi:hypothetical protein
MNDDNIYSYTKPSIPTKKKDDKPSESPNLKDAVKRLRKYQKTIERDEYDEYYEQ